MQRVCVCVWWVCVCVCVTAAQYVPVLNKREMNALCAHCVCGCVYAMEQGVYLDFVRTTAVYVSV